MVRVNNVKEEKGGGAPFFAGELFDVRVNEEHNMFMEKS